ncbi:MAG: DUF4838 domain-containing protein, partial [Candidatus Hydrogenedentes bacterium]|nr:DUF4838 domain-containing protein [Candidatus Hydrogenedentota bacterium]
LKAGRWDGPQPCCTNPDAIRIITESVLAELRANPGRRNVSVSINDHHDYCECERCAALDEKEGSHAASTLYLVNAVADAVKQEFPDTYVGTLAYIYTRTPPKHMKPRDNVQLQLCSIECCVTKPLADRRCKKNRAFCRDLRDWAKVSDNIWIWNYNTNFHYYDMPCANLRVIGPNVRLFAENHVKGVFMQANGNGYSGELSDLRNYVTSRTLWSPALDTWDLVEEFCRLHYGAAAGTLLEYLDYIHDVAEASGCEPNCFGNPIEFGITKEVAARIFEYFSKALAEAENDAVRARVEKASICAYRAVLQLCGDTVVDGNRVRLVYPAPYEGVFERYKELCATYDMRRPAERYGRDDLINILQQRMDGLDVLPIENDTWEAICLPDANGKLLRLMHKPSGTLFGAGEADLFTVDYQFPAAVASIRCQLEEWGIVGVDRQVTGFEAESDGTSIRLKKTLDDGSVLVRTIALDGERLAFRTHLTHNGPEPKRYQVMFHPEWYLGTRTDSARVIRAYILDNGKYRWFNQGWDKGDGPGEDLLRTATGGKFAFFNRERGYGILETYDPAQGVTPRLWWGPDNMHINLEVWTPEFTLEPGGEYTYGVTCEFLAAPPK